jgi:hypothetical protein
MAKSSGSAKKRQRPRLVGGARLPHLAQPRQHRQRPPVLHIPKPEPVSLRALKAKAVTSFTVSSGLPGSADDCAFMGSAISHPRRS